MASRPRSLCRPHGLQGGLKLPPIRSQEELQTALTRLGSLRPDQVRDRREIRFVVSLGDVASLGDPFNICTQLYLLLC